MHATTETFDLSRPGRHPGHRSATTVWLFRHGQVHEDWHGKAYGGADVPLSAAGERDTQAVAHSFAALRPALVLSSTLQRARRLGEALALSTGAPLVLDAGLVEIARGRWQGRRVDELWSEHTDEVRAFYGDPWNYGAHGGETDRDVLARAWPALERGLEAARGKCLCVTAHYNVMRILIARAIGIAPEHSFRLRIDLSAICRLVDGPRGWQLERANVRTPHDGFALPLADGTTAQ